MKAMYKRSMLIEQERRLQIIPSWIDDESLYSWCCRWHLHTLNRTRTTGVALFGVPSAAKVWHAPNPFGWFDRVTMGLLGAPSSILKHRTVAGSYLSLAQQIDRQRVQLGQIPPAYLFSAKSGVGASLRYCETCASQHFLEHGVAIWRITHQLPGAGVCIEHCRPLVECMEGRQIWASPHSTIGREIRMVSSNELQLMVAVAKVARKIFENAPLDVNALRGSARKVLCEAYGALDAKRLDPERVERDWRCSILYQWCARSISVAKAFPRLWLTDVIRGRRSERNPMRWAFAIAYFCEQSWTSIDGFFTDATVPHSNQISLWADMGGIPHEILRAFTTATNLKQAAAELGVTAPTVRRWVCTHPEIFLITQHWKFRR
ncbi:TniQ family protein [Acidovorax sp. sic0104]|uniref:TniQ family protein n=1 Tax=Acidovorax sp. sic0104 TaxID=2854784 RepID=UPI00351D7B99